MAHTPQQEWTTLLTKSGEMDKHHAAELGQKLACLPAPTQDAKHYLTNDFLKNALHIDSPADRARILLATSRCGPEVDHSENLNVDERAIPEIMRRRAVIMDKEDEDGDFTATLPEGDAGSEAVTLNQALFVSPNSANLIFRKFADSQNHAHFVDLCGGYGSLEELAVGGETVQKSEFFKAACAVFDFITNKSQPLQSTTVVPDEISDGAKAILADLVDTEHVHSKSLMFAPMFANTIVKPALLHKRHHHHNHEQQQNGGNPLSASPSFVASPSARFQNQIGSVVLLVPHGCVLDLLKVKPSALDNIFMGASFIKGLETEESTRAPVLANDALVKTSKDDTKYTADARFLTRWILLANKQNRSIALVHKDDTYSLANLRKKWATSYQKNENGSSPSSAPVDEEDDDTQEVFEQTMVDFWGTFLNEYTLAMDDCDTVLDQIESFSLSNRGGKAMSAALHHLSRRAAAYQRALELSKITITEAADFFDVENATRSAEERCASLIERAASIQDRSINLLNLVVALSGFHVADAFNLLTLFTGSLAGVGFFATVYGQNFTVFPEVQLSRYNYFYLVLAMIVVFTASLLFLKSKGL